MRSAYTLSGVFRQAFLERISFADLIRHRTSNAFVTTYRSSTGAILHILLATAVSKFQREELYTFAAALWARESGDPESRRLAEDLLEEIRVKGREIVKAKIRNERTTAKQREPNVPEELNRLVYARRL